MSQQFVLPFPLAYSNPSSLACGPGLDSSPATGLERKLEHLRNSPQRRAPTPTALTKEELNVYLASGKVKLPAGVESVRFQAEPGIVTATLPRDYDE